MADRKVLVRYYPPDFDPQKLREKGRALRRRLGSRGGGGGSGAKLMNVRFMFPFTLCCDKCSEFTYIGTKFNSRVERAVGEDYLTVPVWRFHGRCPHCRNEIVFKTDPQNTDYTLERGGQRICQVRKRTAEDPSQAAARLKDSTVEAADDQVKAFEEKSVSVAREIAATQALDELRTINRRFLSADSTLDKALEWIKRGGVAETAVAQDAAELPAPPLTAEEEDELTEARNLISQRELKKLYGITEKASGDEVVQQSADAKKIASSSALRVEDLPAVSAAQTMRAPGTELPKSPIPQVQQAPQPLSSVLGTLRLKVKKRTSASSASAAQPVAAAGAPQPPRRRETASSNVQVETRAEGDEMKPGVDAAKLGVG